jgi:hypothetical protein
LCAQRHNNKILKKKLAVFLQITGISFFFFPKLAKNMLGCYWKVAASALVGQIAAEKALAVCCWMTLSFKKYYAVCFSL